MEKETIKIKLFDKEYDCYLNIARYQNNNRLYLGLDTKDDSFSDITINLSDEPCLYNSTIFVNRDMPNEVKKQLENHEILSTYLYTVDYNMGDYDCYMVDMERLHYYDPLGFENAGLKLDVENDLEIDVKI